MTTTTFPANGPVAATIKLPAASLTVRASVRDDVSVTVEPSNAGRKRDIAAAEAIEVALVGDRLSIAGPALSSFASLPWAGGLGVVNVTVDLPAGSAVKGKNSAGQFAASGPLGSVDMKVSAGEAYVEQATVLNLVVSTGTLTVGRVNGPVNLVASMGTVDVQDFVGDGSIVASMGEVSVASVTGNLTVTASMGAINVGAVSGTITASASMGAVEVDRIVTGKANLKAKMGSVDVGIPDGTAAWLDVSAPHGSVRNDLAGAGAPNPGDPMVEIHARSTAGNVTIHKVR
ncbi:MAG: DUF4097 family beta strand repeat-containing protein [Cellulomonadaceae bacterium]|nr:DUF4097 family beta strand repeat-containing protein [Cellulomonadaceae bacterium]